MIGNPFSKFFGPDPTTGQRLQDQDTLRETMSKLRSNMEKGEVAGSLYFRQTINHLNLKLYGHGTDDNTLTAAEGILTDGKLKHKKGSIQYGILGNPAYRPHDEGTGLFILDPQLQDEQIFEGPNEVSLKSIKYIVFSEENVESIRSDPKFVQYSAKIFSYSELAEKLNKDNALLATKGGIDLNSANMNLQIKRDGRGVPLPLAQQDMAQLSRIQGFEPEILEITPAVNLPILSELRQKLQAAAT